MHMARNRHITHVLGFRLEAPNRRRWVPTLPQELLLTLTSWVLKRRYYISPAGQQQRRHLP